MKKISILCVLFFYVFSLYSEDSVTFEFIQHKDDAYSYLSTVEEDVFYNGYLNHHAQIINRISSKVINVAEDGEAFIFADYMTTDDSISNRTGNHLVWGEEATSVFARKKNGELTISDDITMPTVRNVPVFPKNSVKIGDEWTAEGKEVQDVRKTFNMAKPLIFPFTAKYLYKENIVRENKELNVITVDYNFNYQTPTEDIYNGTTLKASSGFSKQVLYWDSKKGILDNYTEEFQIKIIDIYNNEYIFQGTAKAEITEYKAVKNEATLQDIQNTVDELALDNISVKKSDKGLTISLENIQFEPDSDVLLESEKIKLKKIASILNKYSNDLLITGHCAERGSVKARQLLSEQRAQSVASFLKSLGVRDEYHIFTQGKGSTEPVATNSTEEGRSRNRRVEITIME